MNEFPYTFIVPGDNLKIEFPADTTGITITAINVNITKILMNEYLLLTKN
jgi:hypothetical protein